ncbi:MAG TPA: sensor domain-containing diguanylate cyclase [Dehalococcoidia bacterium]|nr:sensor domain-containing diguanylate cyclase [Dehalococcoidia bacterium]
MLRVSSPKGLLRLYALIVLATATVAVVMVVVTSSGIESRAKAAGDHAQASIQASRIQAGLGQPITLWSAGFWSVFQDPSFLALSPEQRGSVNAEILRDFNDFSSPTANLPPLTINLADRQLLDFQRSIDAYLAQIDQLAATAQGVDTRKLVEDRERLTAKIEAYLGDHSLTRFRDVFAALIVTQNELGDLSTQLSAGTTAKQVSLHHATDFARILTIAAMTLLAATMVGATYFVGRLIQRAFSQVEAEKSALSETSVSLKHRNDQLSALYNVFSEITDTLSLRYVVSATLREALQLMDADMTVMRILRGQDLVVVGAQSSSGRTVEGMAPVSLGEGPTGRAAKRGRSLRIDSGAQAQMSVGVVSQTEDALGPSSERGPMESGIVVPLIVGARVVGTLAIWSRRTDKFTAEDERILEMMASQVATAVAAADTTEQSERRAHQDALTGLPNRHELNDDLKGDLANLIEQGRRAVVAMADIDHFKRLNDDFGHKVGDVTLQKIASILRNAVRGEDRVYRFGGEEFVLIFFDVGPEGAMMLADRVRSSIASTPFSGDHLEPVGPITISIGLAAMPDHGDDFEKLIELADAAMYQAKATGRDKIVLWSEEVPRLEHTAATRVAAKEPAAADADTAPSKAAAA